VTSQSLVSLLCHLVYVSSCCFVNGGHISRWPIGLPGVPVQSEAITFTLVLLLLGGEVNSTEGGAFLR